MPSRVYALATGLGFLEGPIALGPDRVAFCDGTRGLVLEYAHGSVREVATLGGGPNGLALGSDDCLYVAQYGAWAPGAEAVAPSIQRIAPSGAVATVVKGQGLVTPNDLAFGPDGRLYFTDSGDTDHVSPTRSGRILAASGHGIETVLDTGPTFPNGIGFDDDGRLLWTESATRRVRRLGARGPETLAELPDGFVPDGFAVAADGRIFVATLTSRGVTVLDSNGARVAHLTVDAEPTNCAFLGSSLIVTASSDSSGELGTGLLCSLETDAVSLPLFRGDLDR